MCVYYACMYVRIQIFVHDLNRTDQAIWMKTFSSYWETWQFSFLKKGPANHNVSKNILLALAL